MSQAIPVLFKCRRFSLWACSLLAGFSLACPNLWGTHVAETLERRFLAEAPPQWEKYRSSLHRLQGTISDLAMLGDKKFAHTHFELKQNSNCRMCLVQSLLKDSPSGDLFAYNLAYAFQLQRSLSDRPWVITGIRSMRGSDPPSEAKKTDENLNALLYTLTTLYTEDLSNLVRLPTFHVLHATPISQDGSEMVRIKFDNPHPLIEPGKSFCPVQSGTMLLDPNRFWCLRACDLRNKYAHRDVRITIETELRDPTAKYPVPKRWILKHETLSKKSPVLTTVRDFDLEEPSVLPADDKFTLTSFGLQEPHWLERRRPRLYLWAAAGAVACLGAALLFRRLVRRAKAQVSP